MFEIMAVTDPSWVIVEFHIGRVEMGPMFVNYNDVCIQTLPPPEHSYHDALGISPGEPHDGPYDHELSDNWAVAGFASGAFSYPIAQATDPYAVLVNFMVVPKAGAAIGKTPDSDAGPMIPNTLFPIRYVNEYFIDGVQLDDYKVVLDVPALDMNLDPPFDAEGHSHFPMYTAFVADDYPAGTVYSSRVTMIDTTGAGWDMKFGFKSLP